jgi:hypothetical protein
VGEGKIRGKLSARLLSKHPWCCFCGGSERAETADHQPAKIIFTNKRRPAGLEFPACHRCNELTRVDETILAFVSRVAGSRREHAVLDRHLRPVAWRIERAVPGLLRRMYAGSVLHERRGLLAPHGVLNPNQPEVHSALCRIAAKLALAEYYQSTGLAAPVGARIRTLWAHNASAVAREPVDQILKSFPTVRSLSAGNWNADHDFFMRVGDLDGHQLTAAFFHESVMLAAQMFIDGPQSIDHNWMRVMAPSAEAGIVAVGRALDRPS